MVDTSVSITRSIPIFYNWRKAKSEPKLSQRGFSSSNSRRVKVGTRGYGLCCHV